MPATCGYWDCRIFTTTDRNPKLAGQLCDGCGREVQGEVVVDTRNDEDLAKLYCVGCEPFIRSADWQRRGA